MYGDHTSHSVENFEFLRLPPKALVDDLTNERL